MPRILALSLFMSSLLLLQACSSRTPVGASTVSAQRNQVSAQCTSRGAVSAQSQVGASSSGGTRLVARQTGMQDAESDYDAVSQAAIDAQIDEGSMVDESADDNQHAGREINNSACGGSYE